MKLVFLPGASGELEFWGPVSELLADLGPSECVAWPGLGGAPLVPGVTTLDDLIPLVVPHLGPDTHLVAQSMGTVVAMQVALQRAGKQLSDSLSSLVLVAAAGGLDMAGLGAVDWRDGASSWHSPQAPRYFIEWRCNLSTRLPAIDCPVLLISGGQDPLSPPCVSEELCRILPHAQHVSLPEGEHDMGRVHAPFVAARIREHVLR